MRCPRALSKPSFWGHLARWEGQLICLPFSMFGHNVWLPNIHSRPLELYPLYKCRAGHLVFSKVAVSQVWHDTIGTTWHWQNEHTVGRTHCWQNKAVGRTRCRQNNAVGRTRLLAEHTVSRTRLLAEHDCRQNCFSGNVGFEPTTAAAQHVISNLPSA